MRFAHKTYRGYGGPARLIFIDAEHVRIAQVIFQELTSQEHVEVGEVSSVTEEILRCPWKGHERAIALHRSCHAQYDWWLRGCDGLVHHVPRLVAVAVLVTNEKGEVATVASVKRGNKIGLPAGGIEFWENPFQAAARELKEETGLAAQRLRFMGYRVLNGTDAVALFRALEFTGTITSSEEGAAAWMPGEVLLDPDRGAYPVWNAWAFSVLQTGEFSILQSVDPI